MSVLDRFRLDEKVAVVTGASSGLGVTFAHALAESGADLVLGARRSEGLARTAAGVEARGRRCVAVETDVRRPESCEQLAEAAVSAYGRLDVLVNNAGIGTTVPATREGSEDFRSVVEVNLFGAYSMAQACARRMAYGGSIINISSVLAATSTGLPQAAYASSKAALTGLTVDLANQWTARKGIRVNTVMAGFFPSELSAHYDSAFLDELFSRRVLVGRMGEPEELAAVVVMLAARAGAYMTGTVVTVDGGVLTT